MTGRAVVRDLLIVTCAISAGIHAALTPEHLREGAAPGGGFLASVLVLAALVVALTRRPDDAVAVGAAALTLGGLIAAWVLAVTTGVPVLHPDVEPVDGIALATKAVEGAGMLAALHLLRRDGATASRGALARKGALT